MNMVQVYFRAGFDHLMSWDGLDHLLYLLVLSSAFALLGWRKLLILVTGFTVGHSLSLLLAYFKWVQVRMDLVELFIPITIIMSAVAFLLGKSNGKLRFLLIGTTAVGVVHGLGFSNFLNGITQGNLVSSLFGFNLGLEVAQMITLSILVGFQWTLTKIPGLTSKKVGMGINIACILACIGLILR